MRAQNVEFYERSSQTQDITTKIAFVTAPHKVLRVTCLSAADVKFNIFRKCRCVTEWHKTSIKIIAFTSFWKNVAGAGPFTRR